LGNFGTKLKLERKVVFNRVVEKGQVQQGSPRFNKVPQKGLEKVWESDLKNIWKRFRRNVGGFGIEPP